MSRSFFSAKLVVKKPICDVQDLITDELIGVKFPEYLFFRINCARHTCLSVVMHTWLPGKYGLWEHTSGDENAVK